MNFSEEQIRQMIRQEIQKDSASSRYQLTPTNQHAHTGIDSPQIHSQDIILSTRASGNITLSQPGTVYRLNLGVAFHPSLILFYGGAINTSGAGIRSSIQGSACLGNSFYFQPQSSTSVVVGGPQQNIIQSSTSFTIDSTTTPPTNKFVPSEEHLIRAAYPNASTIVAQATVTSFTNNTISITTGTVAAGTWASGWEIDGNFVII